MSPSIQLWSVCLRLYRWEFADNLCLLVQFTELIHRGWSAKDLAGLAGENILRVLEGAEKVAKQMKKEGKTASMAIYEKRTDLGKHRKADL